jgi:hypothetical protein
MLSSPALPRPVATPVAIPIHEWLPWALFAGVVMLFLLYVVGTRYLQELWIEPE